MTVMMMMMITTTPKMKTTMKTRCRLATMTMTTEKKEAISKRKMKYRTTHINFDSTSVLRKP